MSVAVGLTYPLTEAVLELTLYGGFVVLFSTVIHLFRTRGRLSWKRPTVFVHFALVLLFLSITANWLIHIYALYEGFVSLGGGIPALVFYLQVTLGSGLSVVHNGLVQVTTLVTDSLLIHRLYAVWSSDRRVIIFPLLVLVAEIACGVHVLYDLSRASLVDDLTVIQGISVVWTTSYFATSIAISIYSTGMISYRLIKVSRSLQVACTTGDSVGQTRWKNLLIILVESAALQTTMAIGVLVCFQFGLLAQSVLIALEPVIFGISVFLIYLRVALGWTDDDGTKNLAGGRIRNRSMVQTISLNFNRFPGEMDSVERSDFQA
ncbi:hypothetical protein FB45DRAFT_1060728, partial [Roridomyces roridus]